MEHCPTSYQVTTFGGLQIQCPDGSIAKLHTHRARALFLLLLVNRHRMIHRELLCHSLWPDLDETSAKSQLRKTLWRVRSALIPLVLKPELPVVQISEHHVGLDNTQLEVDVWQFEDVMESLELKNDGELNHEDAESLLTAIRINCDTFAAGTFDEWCLAERESMCQSRLAAMERMVGYHRVHEHWVQAVHWAQQALQLDPIREQLHLAIMACRYSMGDRASAVRQYILCEEVLKRELGINPSIELRDLYHQLIGPENVPSLTKSNRDIPMKKTEEKGDSGTAVSLRLAHRVDVAISTLSAVRDSLEGLSSKV